ncbi:MAG: glutamate--cysteine ligase [Alphaproteobacteria bacterium]|nr:MAG: glutamate--cysteine ligase [Alphaproteobacteria bacterium]
MSTREDGPESPVIETRDQLVAEFARGCKPRSEWRIGTEHEKFGFHIDALTPLAYEEPAGIRALLDEMARRYGYHKVMEGDNVIALKMPDCPLGGSITLEPGGQFELSGAPLETLHQTCDEVNRHLEQVREIADAWRIGFLGLGFSPKWTLEETPRMPKGRYKVMRSYMPRMGRHGLDMMHRTCTIQVNLDFADEADMVRKLRVGLALQPVATAIFANSPFTEGKPNGFLSWRSEMWRDTDPDRTGMLPWVFEEGMGFERYVDYALDVPMYFVYRNGRYIDVSGASFRDFLAGRLEALPGEKPTEADWTDHVSTLFPEVRLKQFLEMRGADSGPWRRICALPAFWVGLLYDADTLEAAWDLVKDWSAEERQQLRDSVPRHALKAPFRGGTVLDIAREAVALSKAGLVARARKDGLDQDETVYLQAVEDIVASGQTPAEELLAKYHGEWGGDIDRLFSEYAF